MQNDLISIVVPCYNLASYTRKCIDSILQQTYQNIELIVIDDGSSDETLSILEEYAQEDGRVILLKQKNKGAGEAINRGIDIATGKYIGFVDNDDWIEPGMYEKLHSVIVENNADMAVCNFNLIFEDHIDFAYATMKNEVVEIRDDVYGYYCRFCACQRPNNYTWSRLYKKDILQKSDVRFEKFRMGADTLLNFKLLPLFRRVAFVNDSLYNYVQRPNSSVHTAAKLGNLAGLYADVFDSLEEYYRKNGFYEFLDILPMYAFTRVRSIFFYSRLAEISDQEIFEDIVKNFEGRKIVNYLTGAPK